MSDLPIFTRTADDEIATLKSRIAQLKEERLVPGVMHCAKCNFSLNRINLYTKSGTMGAGDTKTEPCPNGCGPLWPVTWEQEARDGWKINEELVTKNSELEAENAALKDERRWIPVSERLPEHHRDIWLFDGYIVWEALYYEGRPLCPDATHWMYREVKPAPPEQEQTNG